MNANSVDRSQAYQNLEDAYKDAYAEAGEFDTLNRALVQHYIAKSSRAAADQLRKLQGGEPSVVERANLFAETAAREDQLTAGARMASFLYKFLPGGAAVGAGVAIAVFLVKLFQDANASGQQIGGKLAAGVAISSGVVYIAFRSLAAVAQLAKSAGKAVEEAFNSNCEAKGILRKLSGPEARVFGPGPLPSRAKSGRAVVNATGPLAGIALAIVIAIPVAIGVYTLAGTATGFEEAKESESGVPGFTTPEFPPLEPSGSSYYRP